MHNALLIAYFSDDPLLREFYQLLAYEMKAFDFAFTGVDLGSGHCNQYTFPITPLDVRQRGRFRRILTGFVPTSKRTRLSVDMECHAEMQAQSANAELVQDFAGKLTRFKQWLKKYCLKTKVRLVVLNHQFSGYHLAARDVCRELEIRHFFWHPGFLPGTMCFDESGQLAESEINERLHNELDLCRDDQERLGYRYRQWVREYRYVRPGKTPESDSSKLAVIQSLAKDFQRVVLVIGANDYRAGILPKSYPKARLHSPVFESSNDLFHAVVHSTDESTLVLYKPHPNVVLWGPQQPTIAQLFPDLISRRVHQVMEVTIRDLLPLVNATVTICSTGAYESLLFGVPAVVTGNLPGSDLGICYHINTNKDDLRAVLNRAVAEGFTSRMDKRTNTFIGYLLARYFFAAGSGACPLAPRNLKTALAELLDRKSPPVPSSQQWSAPPKREHTRT